MFDNSFFKIFYFYKSVVFSYVCVSVILEINYDPCLKKLSYLGVSRQASACVSISPVINN